MIKGMYIHIPFCRQICHFCDFTKMVSDRNHREQYVCALIREIEEKKSRFTDIETIYLGGGTPGYLDSDLLKEIFCAIGSVTNKNKIKEFTLEANLQDVTHESAKFWKQSGVNRVSLGVQTIADDILKTIGRPGGLVEAKRAMDILRDNGFGNINIDMIYGLPGETMEIVDSDIQAIKSLNPDHVSWYSLILEPKTKLFYDVSRAKTILPDEEIVCDMSDAIIEKMEQFGYHRYEISNFSRPGMESKHNLACWNLEEYIGVGMGACSQYDSKRYRNISLLKEYINAVNGGEDLMIEEPFDRDLEMVMLGLRKTDGIDRNEFADICGKDVFDCFPELKKHLENGLLYANKERIMLTKKGLDLANIVMSDLFREA